MILTRWDGGSHTSCLVLFRALSRGSKDTAGNSRGFWHEYRRRVHCEKMNDELTEKTTGEKRNIPMPEWRVIAAISPEILLRIWMEQNRSFSVFRLNRSFPTGKSDGPTLEMMELLASVINRLSSPSSLLHHCLSAILCLSPCTISFVLYIILFLFLFLKVPLFRLVCRYIPREHAPRPDPPLESRAPNTAPFHSPAPICFTRIQCRFPIVFRDVSPFPLTSAVPSHFLIQRRPAERKTSTWR